MYTSRLATILVATAVVTFGACKKKEGEPTSDKLSSSKPSDKPSAGNVIELKKFATDRMTIKDLDKVYPSSSNFTMKATL